tara:strand:- start:1463 stop:2404 length:942 start_codon:yes stop_codon:yes gene_type:complete
MDSYLTTTFYHFVKIEEYKKLQPVIQKFCDKSFIKGTILLASEGINGTLSADEKNINGFHHFIKNDERFKNKFKNISHKESWAKKNPFYRMKVKLKKEIVTLGVEGISPTKKVGKYVNPDEWNELISDPDTIIIDTRNTYEVDIGSFKGAVNPKTKSFRELPQFLEKNIKKYKGKKIAMFCTGGIRCEKATSFLVEKGIENVFHLQGGILKYLEKISKEKSLWEGECFVFDQRVAVTHKLKEGKYNQCFACRHPLSPDEMLSEQYKKGTSCPYCYNKLSNKKKSSLLERQKQIDLARKKGEEHIGKIINKGKI